MATTQRIPRYGNMPTGPEAGGRNCATGCGSWSAGWFQYRGLKTAMCEDCSRRWEREQLVAEVGVPVRDVDRDGLGDRIGLAIESVKGQAVYVKGTDKINHYLPGGFVVYVHGVQLPKCHGEWTWAYLAGAKAIRGRS
jgi:hypothetical protein